MSIGDAHEYLANLELGERRHQDYRRRLKILKAAQLPRHRGVGYLTLSRSAGTLSGGEARQLFGWPPRSEPGLSACFTC